jgi:hypothetical protein
MLPLDLQLDLNKKYNKPDTVYVAVESEKDSSEVSNLVHKSASTRSRVTRKYRKRHIPLARPDTLVKKPVDVGREENPTDTIGPPKASIILIVDGEEVYKR